MPSVASEVSASQQSRFHQSNARSRADSGDRSQNSPFSEMLDSAAPAPEPTPAPRNARADNSDATRPPDKSRKTDAPADRNTSNNTKDASDVSDAKDAKDTTTADGDATAKNAKAGDDAAEPAGTGDSTTTAATDPDAESKPDADVAAALQAMFVDPAQPVIAADAPVIAAPQAAAADTPAPDASAVASGAPQIDALIALQAAAPAEQKATPANAAAPDQVTAAAAEAKPAAKDDGFDAIKTDAKANKDSKVDAEVDAKVDAKHDTKTPTQAKVEVTADTKASETQPQSDQDGDAEQQNGGKAAGDVRHSAAKPAGDDPAPETRGHHATDAAGAAKVGAAHIQNVSAAGMAASTEAAAVASAAAAAAAPGSSAIQAQPQTLTPGHIQAQLQAGASNAAAVPLSGVAVEIAAQATAGKQHFEIRLDPPELGRIDVKLDIDADGNTTTRLFVERTETLDLLKRDANQLERALQQAGLKTSDNAMEFSLRQQFAQSDDQAASSTAKIVVPDDEAAPFPAQRQSYGRLLGAGGGLDIRV